MPNPRSPFRKKLDSLLDTLEEILSGPRLARVIVGLVAVSVALFVGVREIMHSLRDQPQTPYQSDGTHVPSQDAPGTAQLTKRQTDYMNHLQQHFEKNDMKFHSTLYDDNESGKLEVRLYDSDKCLWYRREKNGKYTEDFIRNQVEAQEKGALMRDLGIPPVAINQRLAQISWQEPPAIEPGAMLPASSMGNCLNPHPGPFNWWWGPPQGCMVAMFRRWQDGCQHYQWFNSCYNVWDAQINWQACVH